MVQTSGSFQRHTGETRGHFRRLYRLEGIMRSQLCVNLCKHVECFVKQDAFIKIVRMEGMKSLWSGLPPTLLVVLLD